jgi:transcription elongation factor Elf1
VKVHVVEYECPLCGSEERHALIARGVGGLAFVCVVCRVSSFIPAVEVLASGSLEELRSRLA